MKWPFKKRKAVIQLLPATELRLKDWQASEMLVNDMNQLRLSPVFRTMLEVLRNESPVNLGLPITGVSIDDRISHACRIEGYQMCLNTIDAMGKFKVNGGQLEPTFEPEPPFKGVLGKVE